jgi:membrane fusion protein (multidrug efflux system)
MRASLLIALALLGARVAFGQGGQMPPTAVETARPKVDTVVERVSAVGTLRAAENVVVRPEFAGRIDKVHFDEGQRVRAGDALFTLDATIVGSEVNEWKATVAQSRRDLDRTKELVERKLAAQGDLDAKRAQLEVDEARLQSAQTRLDKSTIKAPFAGVVGLRKVSPGEYVTAGQELVSLVQLDPIKLDFRVPESALARIRPGQGVRIEVDAFPGESFNGSVYAIDPQLDAAGRAVQLRATIPNESGRLRPGLFARVELELDTRADALLLPEQALWPQGEKQFVYVVDNGTAKLVEVSIGVRQNGMVEITRGLDKDAQVITAGQLKIGPGMPVQPIDAAAAAGATKPAS